MAQRQRVCFRVGTKGLGDVSGGWDVAHCKEYGDGSHRRNGADDSQESRAELKDSTVQRDGRTDEEGERRVARHRVVFLSC